MPAIAQRTSIPAIINDTLPVPSAFPSIPNAALKDNPSLNQWQDDLDSFWKKTRQALADLNTQTSTAFQQPQAGGTSGLTKISSGGFTSLIDVERIQRITADGALAELITTVEADFTSGDATLHASIVTDETASVTRDTALATLITTLTATVTTNASTASAQVISEQIARSTADTAFAANILTLTATVTTNAGTAAAAVTAEQSARATADTAIASSITTLTATVTTNNSTLTANITTEATARASGDAALAATIATLSASSGNHIFLQASTSTPTAGGVGDLWFQTDNGDKVFIWNGTAWVDGTSYISTTVAAAVSTEQTARIGADGALASSITSVLAIANGNTASITTEATSRANADTAISALITSLTSTVGINTANISSEASTRASADSALASSISTLSASSGNHIFLQASTSTPSAGGVGDLWFQTDNGDKVFVWNGTSWADGSDSRIVALGSVITSETSARVSGDSTLASSISGVLSVANSAVSAVNIEATTRANNDGNLSGKYTLTVTAGNVVTGLNITSSTGSGTNVSDVIFNAGNFKIYNTSTSTGVAPFQVSGGVVTVTGSLVIHPTDINGTALVVGGAASDVNSGSTTVNGGQITTGTVTLSKLNFTPATTSNIVATINASTEGTLYISASRIQINSSVTFASGYDPSGKIASGGAAADVNGGSTTINGGQITTSTITATKISVSNLSSINSDLGSITAGSATIGSGTQQLKFMAGTLSLGNISITSSGLASDCILKAQGGDTSYIQIVAQFSGVAPAVIRGYDVSNILSFVIGASSGLGVFNHLAIYKSGVQKSLGWKSSVVLLGSGSTVTFDIDISSANCASKPEGFLVQNSNDFGMHVDYLYDDGATTNVNARCKARLIGGGSVGAGNYRFAWWAGE